MAQGDATAKARLSADDWAQAALDALAEGGLAAVAVEPIAKRLGTTKGSFYWHFKDRAALVEAALARWEQRSTDDVIAEIAIETDPAERLHRLFAQVIDYAATGRIELALLASADQASVAATLRRVADRRIEYVAELLRELGLTAGQARTRAVVAVSIYHGFNQLARVSPDALPSTEAQRRLLVDSAFESLLPKRN
ncbi:TetR/AcrR family transcriptional regulator [Nocardia pseudovaccinii]|uniref:TetR/AcrR family transcriptional regulator n=1 Tax=Nocardia pseudovaccinii TaxID=189540 RepID=UPI0007A420B6|nr:TetR/AcrR family transcriptional regulator [Nocardia pseudovaccinii]